MEIAANISCIFKVFKKLASLLVNILICRIFNY